MKEQLIQKVVPLTLARKGQNVKVVAIEGGKQVTLRLLSMGITSGVTLKIEKAGGNGPILVALNGSKVALGHGVGQKVMVE